MSQDDQLRAEGERKHQAAVVIAEKVGLLTPCRFGICDDLTWHEEQLDSAYHYAAKVLKTDDPLTRDFKTQRELTDLIKSLEDDFDGECACDRTMAKD
jgi:hypothetical protein